MVETPEVSAKEEEIEEVKETAPLEAKTEEKAIEAPEEKPVPARIIAEEALDSKKTDDTTPVAAVPESPEKDEDEEYLWLNPKAWISNSIPIAIKNSTPIL